MIIDVKNLNKTFTTYERGNKFSDVIKSVFARKEIIVNALHDISFNIEEGELVGFLGPNGAGKSTTLKILTGILHPTSGEVNIMGYTPWLERKKYVGKIGAVFGQKSQLFFDVPPIDSFYLNKAIYDIPDNEFKKTLDNMAELLNIQNIMKKPTRQLSLGERMKCEFMMSMLHNPKIVFLDEPTIGLDVIAKDKIREFIVEMNKKGTTFILTTHDLADIEHLAKRIIVINGGEMVFDDSLQSLKKYLGTKKIITLKLTNILPDMDAPGIKIINRISDYEAEIELDYNLYNMNEFIAYISKTSSIEDMSIKEIPIEKIIKNLYSNKTNLNKG